jgi:endonuclease/exonuclease/phosphatase family metal-dependent hydrolase
MRRRVKVGTRAFTTAVLLFAGGAVAAQAQTVVVLDEPSTEVVDNFVRGGNYANTVFDTGVLITKSNSNASYRRHTLLKFDTHNFVPANAAIQSAILTLTLRSSEADTRTLGAYRVTTSFDEPAATWYRRKSGYNWSTGGGDLGSRYAEASVPPTPGLRVTFNVTRLVQETVNGTYGSRYTRIALRDLGASSAASYKEFYSSEAADAALRPQLVVTYGGTPPPPPPPPPPPASTGSLRVLHWNTHYGIGISDGVYNIERIAAWIASVNPDVVSLNEVEKYVSSHGNEDQPARYAAMLRERTGQPWYYHFAQRYGDWTANGGGNLILSRYPIGATADLEMDCNRSAGLATITVSGRNINVVSTHLDSQSSSCRISEIREILPWMRTYSSPRIFAGDFNASPGNSTLSPIFSEYLDGWVAADALGTADDYDGNSRYGATHEYRIDYILTARDSSALSVRSARVYDARDSSGRRMSDHKPLMVVYDIR